MTGGAPCVVAGRTSLATSMMIQLKLPAGKWGWDSLSTTTASSTSPNTGESNNSLYTVTFKGRNFVQKEKGGVVLALVQDTKNLY